jgi:hypothetical protein
MRNIIAAILVNVAVITAAVLYFSAPLPPQEHNQNSVDREETGAKSDSMSTPETVDYPSHQDSGNAVYRWVDHSGAIHYGDTAPHAGQNVARLERINLPPLQTVVMTPTNPDNNDKSTVTTNVQSTQQPPLVTEQNVPVADTSCAQATSSLERLRARMRAGYPEAESNWFHSEERRLVQQFDKYCLKR